VNVRAGQNSHVTIALLVAILHVSVDLSKKKIHANVNGRSPIAN
jgi:hypothetical protein